VDCQSAKELGASMRPSSISLVKLCPTDTLASGLHCVCGNSETARSWREAVDSPQGFGYAFPSALFHNTQRAQARFASLVCSKSSLTIEDLMSHAECGVLFNYIQQACESSQESGCAGRSNGPQICVFFRVFLV